MSQRHIWCLASLLFLVCLCSCKKTPKTGYLKVRVDYVWNTDTLNFDQQWFSNISDEELQIESVRFFMRQASLTGDQGKIHIQGFQSGYFSQLASEREIQFTYDIPQGSYTHFDFILGFDDTENVSHRFSEMPEQDMFWPENLGGGYHFLKIDGKWKLPNESQDQGYGLHLGRLIRQRYDTIWSDPNTIERIDTSTLRFPMHFKVSVPTSIDIHSRKITTLNLIMDLSQFWDGPNTFSLQTDGTAIMQNENAMTKVRTNGPYVFR